MTDHISARVFPEPAGFGYAVDADGDHWSGHVSSREEARAVAWAAIRGIVRARRLHAIKDSWNRENRERLTRFLGEP